MSKKSKKAKPAAKSARPSKADANYFPREGSVGHQIWSAADKVSAKKKSPATFEEVTSALGKGVNKTSIRSGYARWRKFHGVEGRLSGPKPAKAAKPKAAAKKAKPVKKAAKAKAPAAPAEATAPAA